jgi:hypothetical protein
MVAVCDYSNVVQRRIPAPRPPAAGHTVTLRLGVAADEQRLARLAALDSSQTPMPPVLVAEVEGQLLAALGLSDGTVVADPFHPTADLIDLLRTRERQLGGKPPVRGSGRLRSWARVLAAT